MFKNGIKDGTLAVLLKLAERPGGVSAAEAAQATGKTSDRCVQLLYMAVKRGRCHKAGPHTRGRWFVHPEHAAAYERHLASVPPPVQIKAAGARGKPNDEMRRQHQAALGQHNRERAPKPVGEPIITSKTKVTIAPPPRSRYQVDDVRRVVDSNQCRPWAKEATR